ncbi:TonB-dependent receptor [Phenylobacterium sp. LjRoot219]|uniref:TonB-dependent receptor n=1 Tax=Phenylobacterium sp. LjRoot219 TaxID=3342283 RepID=UPI003ECDEC27
MDGANARRVLLVTTACATALCATAVLAQDAKPPPRTQTEVMEVIVTARKRQESILNVPVVETAVSGEQLEKLQVSDLRDLQKLVPGLNMGRSVLSIGALPSIRGVGTASLDPGVDQSIALNLDGMALGQGLAFQSGMFDVQMVEVLKGPQALFYGKSSPGGVISLRTADPTSQLEVIARAGYEIEAREKRGELIVSGPLTDTLKGRLSGMYSDADGYFINIATPIPGLGGVAPRQRESQPQNYMVRGTLLWNPTSQFDARLKVNYAHDEAIDAESGQLTSCPNGTDFNPAGFPFNGGDNCKLDRYLRVVYMDPANYPGIANGGVPFLENTQKYGTLELNYRFTPELTLTSTTGVYQLRSSSLVNTGRAAAPGPALAIENQFKRREVTQELRLNSDFEGPVNFTAGAFYQDGRIGDRVTTRGNSAFRFPARIGDGETSVDIKTYSGFGQLRWSITPELELAGGARYTDEERTAQALNYLTPTPTVIPIQVPRLHSKNTAPEVTLTYRPKDNLTLFGAYKRAYKSGSFSIATVPTPNSNPSFDDEKVKGGEIGLKSRLLDRRLALNVAVYDYRYTGLQVGAVEQISNGQPVIRTINAGAAKTYGVDFDANYRPPQVEGLGLTLAVNWNRGRYTELDNVQCWSGQTISEGCNQAFNPMTGRYVAQDASGTPLIRAPEWQATFGFDYEVPVREGLTVAITNNNQYTSKYATFIATNRPNDDNFQPEKLKVDLSVALRSDDERWELAVIGKNISDEITSGTCSPAFFSSGLALNTAGQVTGAATRGSAGIGEVGCYTDRGREVWLRFTYRPFAGRS